MNQNGLKGGPVWLDSDPTGQEEKRDRVAVEFEVSSGSLEEGVMVQDLLKRISELGLEGLCQTEEKGSQTQVTGGVEASGVKEHGVFRGRVWTVRLECGLRERGLQAATQTGEDRPWKE